MWHVVPKSHLSLSLQGGDVNPFTKQPLSASYKKILEARKKLPVYSQMDDFYKMVSASHISKVSSIERP